MRPGNMENRSDCRDPLAGLSLAEPADEEAGADSMTEFGP
jgi:hypothetical protein